MAESFKIPRDDAAVIYKATLKSYSLDGTISRELQERIIGFQRKQLKVDKRDSLRKPCMISQFCVPSSKRLKKPG